MTANSRQVDGNHYQGTAIQHWDFAASNSFDYFQGQITKYVTRWKKKNGIKDLEKAKHFLEKYIEVEKAKAGTPLEKNRIDKIPRVDNTGQPHPFGFHKEIEMYEK